MGLSLGKSTSKKEEDLVVVESEEDVNGESVQREMDRERRMHHIRAWVSGLALSMGIVGLWGDKKWASPSWAYNTILRLLLFVSDATVISRRSPSLPFKLSSRSHCDELATYLCELFSAWLDTFFFLYAYVHWLISVNITFCLLYSEPLLTLSGRAQIDMNSPGVIVGKVTWRFQVNRITLFQKLRPSIYCLWK